MNDSDWVENVPRQIRDDPLWEIEVYRKALFFSDLVWQDCEAMLEQNLGRPIAWQLLRSAGSISATMEEGYGRGFGKDYALSQENLWPLYEQMVAEAGGEENKSRWWKPDTVPETMLATLAHLNDQYGGAKTYLQDAGLTAKEIEQLRKLFIC